MQMLGHDGPPTNVYTSNLLTGKRLDRCPLRTLQLAREAKSEHVREVDRYVDTYYPAYEDKHVLVAGGIADQPARYVDLIQLVRRIDRETETKFRAVQKENGE
jgi:hypothetical protein